MNTFRFRLFRGTIFGGISIVLIALAWNYSVRVPVLRQPDSSWIPLAISPDGETLAVADSNLREGWWTHRPGGPIRLLRTCDLAPAGPLVQTPEIELGGKSLYPPLVTVELSPDGKLLAVIQNRDMRDDDMLELLLIRLPSGEVWKSFPLPYDRWDRLGGIARRLFSIDGRLMAWHELSQDEVRRDTVRVWDVTAGRERFAVDGATYPVLSPDGKILAAVEGKTCRLYDTQTGKVVRSLSLPGHFRWQPWPEFSADGQLLAISCLGSSYRNTSVIIFEVSSGQTVFTAPEWSPVFIDGSTLVTVKGDSVLFRDTDTWKVRASVSFSLGQDGNGQPVSPEPHPLRGRGAVLVYERAHLVMARPIKNMRRFGRALGLNLGPERDAWSWIDAETGAVTQFSIDDGRQKRVVVAPDGKRLVAKGLSDITVWDLPPARSRVPTIVLASSLTFVYLGWIFIGRRNALRARQVSNGNGENDSL